MVENGDVRVVLAVLDGQPVRHVRPTTTPLLAQLATAGGWSPSGGQAVLTSATYANHATFATGVDAATHGLYANHVVRDGRVRARPPSGRPCPRCSILVAPQAGGRWPSSETTTWCT